MKDIISLICIIVGGILATIIIFAFLFSGFSFAIISLKDNFNEEYYSMVFGFFCYTALISAITLLVRWAFS